jgi:anhydro-N-acetylmuramic acid kinase
MKKMEIIGLMSGTSMDGLDIAHVLFEFENNTWKFSLLKAETYTYSSEFYNALTSATSLNVPEFLMLDKRIGKEFAEMVNDFISKNNIQRKNISAIASHGHTTFHQPQNGFTSQIGCGDTISFFTKIPVINDFRTKDVIAGGQGAPLVPIGDLLLFQNLADSFLNLGGIANISFEFENKMTAFDICPANLPLNKLVAKLNLEFDKDGEIAKSGIIEEKLLKELNQLSFYAKVSPKSLGTEWLESEFYPLINFETSIENNLATIIEHEAMQIASVLNENTLKSVLITGGGAKNSHLIERLKYYFKGEIILPNKDVIEFKEAIIFAFLGALYLEKQTNCISSVTGASHNVIGGVYHIPN